MDMSEDVCKQYVETSWETYIQSELPQSDNTKYFVNINIKYNCAKKEYNINCDCNITKSINTFINVPEYILNQSDLNNFYSYMNLLKDNLIDKINNVESDHNCIEIDGKKYYPKEDE